VRTKPPFRPKLDEFTGVIDAILAPDKDRSKKQRHASKRIFERLRAALLLRPDAAKSLRHEGDFPVAEKIGAETVSLPFYPAMPLEYLDVVVDSIRNILQMGQPSSETA
jgi:dTDP-4-amino-4,6-dideoxygalactose transaminase